MRFIEESKQYNHRVNYTHTHTHTHTHRTFKMGKHWPRTVLKYIKKTAVDIFCYFIETPVGQIQKQKYQ